MEKDPLWVLSLSLPAGWALDPYSCALHKLVFIDWSRPHERQLYAMVEASQASAQEGDAAWEAHVRAALPRDVQRAERRDGAVLWVERPGQRWVFVRGPRFDAVLEQVGVPLGGALTTPDLQQAVRTLDVAINSHLGERFPQAHLSAHMQAAHAAHQRQDRPAALRELQAALHVARSTWLHSLAGGPMPDVGAAVAMGEVMLRFSMVTGTSAFLREAGLVLLRCRLSLQDMHPPGLVALRQDVDRLLAECRTHLAQLAGEQPAANAFRELLMRSEVLGREASALIKHSPQAALSPAADKAVQDAMSAAALASRGLVRTLSAEQRASFTQRGVVDPDEQLAAVNQLLRVLALRQLVNAGTLQASGRAQANSAQERTRCANLLLAARELAEISPGPEHETGVAVALNQLAGALVGLGDEASLQEVETLLDEAYKRLPVVQGPPEALRAQILLNQAWLQYYQRRAQDGLATAERALAAARACKAEPLVRAAQSLRAMYLGMAGRIDEAKAEARAALHATHDDAASTHCLNLAVVLHGAGDVDGAVRALRDGLAAAIADQPLAPEVVRLLFLAAVCQEATNPVGALAATEAAQTVLDALRIGLDDAQDLIGFDDAAHHRQLAGSLVQRRLDAGDPLSALASADRHRARTLLQQLETGPRHRARQAPRTSLPTAPSAQAPLDAQIAFIETAARRALEVTNEHGRVMAPRWQTLWHGMGAWPWSAIRAATPWFCSSCCLRAVVWASSAQKPGCRCLRCWR